MDRIVHLSPTMEVQFATLRQAASLHDRARPSVVRPSHAEDLRKIEHIETEREARPRPFCGVTAAPRGALERPADLDLRSRERPVGMLHEPDPTDDLAARSLLDREHSIAEETPMHRYSSDGRRGRSKISRISTDPAHDFEEAVAIWEQASHDFEGEDRRPAESDSVVSHQGRSASPLARAVHDPYVRCRRAQTTLVRSRGSAMHRSTIRRKSDPPLITTSGYVKSHPVSRRLSGRVTLIRRDPRGDTVVRMPTLSNPPMLRVALRSIVSHGTSNQPRDERE